MRTLNGIGNLIFIVGFMLLVASAIAGTFYQGWPWYQSLAAIAGIIISVGLFIGWVAGQAKKQLGK